MKIQSPTLKALGALLTYPDETLAAAVPELRVVLEASASVPPELKPRLRSLLDTLETTESLDLAALGPLHFETAAWSDIEPLASRAHAVQTALVLAKPPASGHMMLKIRLLSPGPVQDLPDVDVSIPPGTQPEKGYGDAALAAAAAIGDAWKARAAIDFNQHATLMADVRFDSLAQWSAMQQKLASVPIVTDVVIAAMNIGEARIAIGYAGTPAQLDDFLSQAALGLENRGGTWWLSAKPSGGVVAP